MCCAEEAHRAHEFMLKGLYHITVIFGINTFLSMEHVKYLNICSENLPFVPVSLLRC